MSFGHRSPEVFREQMRRKHLTRLMHEYRALRALVSDPCERIRVDQLKRLAAMRAVLISEGVRL